MIVISKTLTLGNWYQLKNPNGEFCRQWVRQEICKPELNSIEWLKSRDNVSKVYFFPNVLNTLGIMFFGTLSPLNRIFERVYSTHDKGFMSWERAEEAKKEIDKFLIKYSKLKVFT